MARKVTPGRVTPPKATPGDPGAVSTIKKPARRRVAAVEVVNPAAQAHELRLAGHSWPETARRTGYPSQIAARLAVRSYLTRAAIEMDDEQRQEALALQLDRYEALLRAWWERATAGVPALDDNDQPVLVLDDRSAGIVLKTLAQIDRLLTAEDRERGVGAQTIVIAGGAEEYIAGLRQAVANAAAPAALAADTSAD